MVQPTGAVHMVPLNDLFFSTTDRKGIIDEANEVFCRIARYPREELLGAPHNIIRHPDMPGGAFKLVWDLLLAGKPVSAYVLNMAADGSAYWAFATIVPIDEGTRFLSVRSKPCNEQLRSSVALVYDSARAFERKAREDGVRKSESARMGARFIEKSILELGYGSYQDFMLDLLPTELAARRALSPTPPGTEVEDPLHRSITVSADAVEGQLASLTTAMESAQEVAIDITALSKAAYDTMAQLESVLARAQLACDEWDNQDELVVTALPAVREKCNGLANALAPMAHEIDEVMQVRRFFRFDVEVARLQNEAIGRYVVAVARGLEDPAVSSKAITSLADALYALVDTDLAHDIEATAELRANIDRVAAALRVMRMIATTWRNLVDTRGLGEVMKDITPALDKALEKMSGEVTRLSDDVGKLVSAVDGFDLASLQAHLGGIAVDAQGFGGAGGLRSAA